jgi:integrase
LLPSAPNLVRNLSWRTDSLKGRVLKAKGLTALSVLEYKVHFYKKPMYLHSDVIMKVSDLKMDETIIEWLTIINVKANTERNYLLGFQWFTEYTGKEPEELLPEAEKEVRDGILPRQRTIKKYLVGFRKYLQDKGLAPLTVKIHMTSVKSFYQAFDIEIPKTRSEHRARSLQKHIEIPTKDELCEVLKVCGPLEKAVILVGVSSGLAANEICNLKVSDFKKGHDHENGITTLSLRREKVEFDFITFLTPEASNAVLDYLNYRARTSKNNEVKRLNQLEKQRVFSDNNYLFIKRSIHPRFLETKDDELRKFDTDAFTKVYRFISDNARKSAPKGTWNIIRSHNMRKYFNSAMLNAGADSFHVEFFMGHTLDSTQAAYFRASPEKLRDLYAKYIPYLTIQKEADVSESPEYLRIKNENQILQAETARHVVERSEIHDLQEKIQKNEHANQRILEMFQLMSADPHFLEKWNRFKKQ